MLWYALYRKSYSSSLSGASQASLAAPSDSESPTRRRWELPVNDRYFFREMYFTSFVGEVRGLLLPLFLLHIINIYIYSLLMFIQDKHLVLKIEITLAHLYTYRHINKLIYNGNHKSITDFVMFDGDLNV